jgi:hypothetical protein
VNFTRVDSKRLDNTAGRSGTTFPIEMIQCNPVATVAVMAG